jgi:hypothetical protein
MIRIEAYYRWRNDRSELVRAHWRKLPADKAGHGASGSHSQAFSERGRLFNIEHILHLNRDTLRQCQGSRGIYVRLPNARG